MEGNHVKRAETAHIVTLQALQTLYQEVFFSHYPEVKSNLQKACDKLNLAFGVSEKEKVKAADNEMSQTIEDLDVVGKMEIFDTTRYQKYRNLTEFELYYTIFFIFYIIFLFE